MIPEPVLRGPDSEGHSGPQEHAFLGSYVMLLLLVEGPYIRELLV